MALAEMDKEDVIAELKKRFRTVAAFERSAGLAEKSVHDVLRGRSSTRVVAAIEDALSKPVDSFRQSELSDRNTGIADPHRLNVEGR